LKSFRSLIHAVMISLLLMAQLANVDLVHADGETPVPAEPIEKTIVPPPTQVAVDISTGIATKIISVPTELPSAATHHSSVFSTAVATDIASTLEETATPPVATSTPGDSTPADTLTPEPSITVAATDIATVAAVAATETPTNLDLTETPVTTDTPSTDLGMPSSTDTVVTNTATPSPTNTLQDTPIVDTPTLTPTDAPTDTLVIDTSTPTPDAVTNTPSAETATPSPTDTPTDAAIADTVTPALADTSSDTSIAEIATPLLDLTITTTPTDSPSATDTTIAIDSTAGDQQLPLLESVPENTDLMVLDQNGEPLSLVIQQTADIIANSDPVWCPDGVAPTPGANGCTASYATMNDLLAFEGAYINSQNVNGTIWITSGTVGDVGLINIDGSTIYSNWANYSLTLQGGWSGFSGDTTIGSNSVFSVPIWIFNWYNTVAINNITNTGGLDITASNLTINNSTFSGNSGDGASFHSWGNVAINTSTFNGNSGNGVTVDSPNTAISNSTFSNNATGASINSPFATVSNSTFDGNSIGLSIDGGIYDSYGNLVGMGCVTTVNNVYAANGQNESITNAKIAPCTETIITPTPLRPSNSTILVPPDQNHVEVSIDCNQFSSFLVAWATGDQIQISCVDGGTARITRVDNTALTPDLPTGYQYVTAYNVEIFQNGISLSLMPEGGFVQPMLASRQDNPNYGIMAWDKDKNRWTLLNEYQKDQYGASMIFLFDPSNLQDTKKILQGTRLVTNENPNREHVRTNFPGLFVLVQQQ
jgi:hypothetical protein